jgi:hypothetical protein
MPPEGGIFDTMSTAKFYTAAIGEGEAELRRIRRKVNGVSLLRVGIFGALGAAVWGLIRVLRLVGCGGDRACGGFCCRGELVLPFEG